MRKEIKSAYQTDFSNNETIERKPLHEEKKREGLDRKRKGP